MDKSIPSSPTAEKVSAYCKKVTIVWVSFFTFNAIMTFLSVFLVSDVVWVIYNGGITNVLMGIIFAVEFIIRKRVQKKMSRDVALSEPDNAPIDRIQ